MYLVQTQEELVVNLIYTMYYCTIQVGVLEKSVEEQKVYLVHTQEEGVTNLIYTVYYCTIIGWCTGEVERV